MADAKVASPDVLAKLLSAPEGDFLRDALLHFVQALMEADVSAQIGAEKYERSKDRLTQRNGYRSRLWDTRAGALALVGIAGTVGLALLALGLEPDNRLTEVTPRMSMSLASLVERT